MLERSRRPLGAEDRAVIERLRQNAVGTTRFDAKLTFLAGAAGLVLGYIWMSTFRWPVVALTVAGAGIGFLMDHRRYRRQRATREAAAAARWNPIIAVGVVEHVVAEASSAVRLDDDEGDTAWFLQTGETQILCLWDWAEHATERVELDLVPGESSTTLMIYWTGKTLAPARPARKFTRGEREPEQGEVLDGTLHELDRLLREPGRSITGPLAAKLANELASLGFYKFVTADQQNAIDGEIENGAYDWYLAAGRAFDGDAERLADGGVKALLEAMQPALDVEGVALPELEESYDAVRGYTLRAGTDEHTLWGEGEAKRSWELTTTRTIALIDAWLASAASDERVHVLGGAGGHDGVFVLLTPAIRQTIARSGMVRERDIPAVP